MMQVSWSVHSFIHPSIQLNIRAATEYLVSFLVSPSVLHSLLRMHTQTHYTVKKLQRLVYIIYVYCLISTLSKQRK